MKLTIGLMTLAIVMSGLMAQAREHSRKANDFPEPIAEIGSVDVIAIPELTRVDRVLVERILFRTDVEDSYYQEDFRVVAAVYDGEVIFKRQDFPNSKVLKKTLKYIASTGACDLRDAGKCLLYQRRGGVGKAIVIGTQISEGGTVEILQGEFDNRMGRGGRNSLTSLMDRLQQQAEGKYLLFVP